MKRFLACLGLFLLAALPAHAQNTRRLYIDTGDIPIAAADSVSGATVIDPVFGGTTPFMLRMKVQEASVPSGPYPNQGRFVYSDTAWRGVSGDTKNIVVYFGVPVTIDKAAGKATIQWACKYTTTLDLVTVSIVRNVSLPLLPDTYALTFTVQGYQAAAPTFKATATVPGTAVVFY